MGYSAGKRRCGSRIPCRRGVNPLGGGRQHTILSNFQKNCMKSRKFWTVGGGGAPLNPPLKCNMLHRYYGLTLSDTDKDSDLDIRPKMGTAMMWI